MGEGLIPSRSGHSASWSSTSSGYPARAAPLRMSQLLSADDAARSDPESPLATDPARPAGLPTPWAPSPAEPAASPIWKSLPPPPAILALFLPSARPAKEVPPGQRHMSTPTSTPLPPPPSSLTTYVQPAGLQAAVPTPPWKQVRPCPPHPPCSSTQRAPPVERKAVTASPRNGRGTADGGLKVQQVRTRRPPLPAQLGYSTQMPNGMGDRTSLRRASSPDIDTARGAERPAVSPLLPLCGTWAQHPPPLMWQIGRLHGRCHSPGSPEAARARPLALRPAAATLGRPRQFARPAPSPRLERECQGTSRPTVQAPTKA